MSIPMNTSLASAVFLSDIISSCLVLSVDYSSFIFTTVPSLNTDLMIRRTRFDILSFILIKDN